MQKPQHYIVHVPWETPTIVTLFLCETFLTTGVWVKCVPKEPISFFFLAVT